MAFSRKRRGIRTMQHGIYEPGRGAVEAWMLYSAI